MPVEGSYEPSAWDWVRNQVEEYERSGGTRANTLLDTGLPVVIVTTRGNRTGKVRKNPVMRVEHDGIYAAVASKGGAPEHPSWYRNLVEHPTVELQDGPTRRDYVARQASGEERSTWWTRAVEVWPDYANYQTKTEREIPVFVLEPAE
jgi:deazaflavin-dependent oxidoreductase (nitroreductase family)